MEAKRLENGGVLLLLSEREANWLRILFGHTSVTTMNELATRAIQSAEKRKPTGPLPERDSSGMWLSEDKGQFGGQNDMAYHFYDVLDEARAAQKELEDL